MKQFMFHYDFDGVYEGGLSSYYVVAMIVAFFRDNKDLMYKDNGEILLELLKFYGDKFNPKEIGISLNDLNQPFFLLDKSQKAQNNLTILDPLNQGVHLGKYCKKIPQILQEIYKFWEKV